MIMAVSTEYTYFMYKKTVYYALTYREGKADGNTIIVNSTLPSVMSLGDYLFVNPMSSHEILALII